MLQDTKLLHKSLLYFCAPINYQKDIKKTIPFAIVPKIIKHLGINLTKEVKDLYIENYKTLMKETEEDTNK